MRGVIPKKGLIRDLRIALGMTQEELASCSSCDVKTAMDPHLDLVLSSLSPAVGEFELFPAADRVYMSGRAKDPAGGERPMAVWTLHSRICSASR